MATPPCTCDIKALFWGGCTCGHLAALQAAGRAPKNVDPFVVKDGYTVLRPTNNMVARVSVLEIGGSRWWMAEPALSSQGRVFHLECSPNPADSCKRGGSARPYIYERGGSALLVCGQLLGPDMRVFP